MKIAWRNVVLQWKKTDGQTYLTIPKGCFPKLLNKLMEVLRNNSKAHIIAGFRKTGIYPINEKEVLSRLPEIQNNENLTEVEKSVLDLLKEMRYGTMDITEPKRKKILEIIPGRSVGTESEDYIDTEQQERQQKIRKRGPTPKVTKNNKENTTTNIYDGKEKNKCTKGKGVVGKKNKTRNENIAEINDTINDFDFIASNPIETMPIVFEDGLIWENEIDLVNEIEIQQNAHDTGVETTYENKKIKTDQNERRLKNYF